MWKRGSRSSALDRAQALLSAKKNGPGDDEFTQEAPAGAVGGPLNTALPNTQIVFSDLSDLSSVSSATKDGADTAHSVTFERRQGKEACSNEELRPQGSLVGGGNRFLKKAPLSATNSSQSPVSRSRLQQRPEPGYVSCSRSGSQAAALSKLAQIESRFRSHMQVQEHARKGASPQPPAALQSVEASLPVSAQSSSDQGLNGKRFLKKKTPVAVENTNTAAAGHPKSPDVGVSSKSRAAGTVIPSANLEMKSLRILSGVSLESDEEDMRKLLGDSLDSTEDSLLRPRRPVSARSVHKTWSKGSQKVHSPPTPPPASSPSNTPPPHSPASPLHRSSPFRFTGQAQARFSPSVRSTSPSPPSVSPLSRRMSSPHRADSPQNSLSIMSGRSEVVSLEELFPVRPDSEDPYSEMSLASSEEFKINVMTLDDLLPAPFGFTEETPGKKREYEHGTSVPGSLNRHQTPPRLTEGKKEEQPDQEEDVLNYQSDFESESKTEPNCSVSQVSEHLQGDEDEEELLSEIRENVSNSDISRGRTEDDLSNTFSETSSHSSDRSQTYHPSSRGGDSRSSVSHIRQTSSHQSRRRSSTRKVLKDAATQVQPDSTAISWSAGMATSRPSLGMTNSNPTPMAVHTLSAETVEALSTYNPSAFVLNEFLKQQLEMTRRFIERSRHLHSSLVQSLEPPNYRYTTLEDTKEHIRRQIPPKLTMEKALEEVLQEMRDCQCS
ncbi:uncharacterized protein C19orf44 homolog isoform X2 [Echeneis naucrates]|uniref:DUF4614 domain-containing protein n=1 Tax=Echeneis naucrates TaxID=173247 RepID=A0A665WNE1_ECHNA|nr:uncharacterized protein C19orf44 homolog isoform X2 [Echeneis naucrates]